MKVSREAAVETRRRIVDVAARLFRERGFDGTGVARIMQEAGLTHGGFYGHFASKSELAAAACLQALERRSHVWDAAMVPGSTDLKILVDAYLSRKHRDTPGDGCIVAAVGTDVVRQPAAVRHAYTTVVKGMLANLSARIVRRDDVLRRRDALATLSGLVGALVLARAVSDPRLSDELLATARETYGGSRVS